MFVTRLISGILLVLAAIFLLFTGGAPLVVVMGILSLIGMFELYRVLKMEKHPVATASYVASVLYYVLVYFELEQWTVALGILLLIISMILCVVKFPQYSIEEAAFGVFGFLYVSIMLSCVYMTRQLDGGNWLVWMIIIGSWGSDTCAYVAGRLIGKHHFSKLSPKKTIEGCIGGVVGSGLIAFFYACFFPHTDMFIWDHRVVLVMIAMVCAVISQFGDLSASAIKRKFDVKDYGKLIPGHGGVLDRFDSVIFVAPFVYYLLVLTSYIKL